MDHTCFIAFPEVVLTSSEGIVLNALASQLQAGAACYSPDVLEYLAATAVDATVAGEWAVTHKSMRTVTSAPFTPHWNKVTSQLPAPDGEIGDWDAVVSTLAIVEMKRCLNQPACVVTESTTETPERPSVAELAATAGLDWMGFGEYLQSLGLASALR